MTQEKEGKHSEERPDRGEMSSKTGEWQREEGEMGDNEGEVEMCGAQDEAPWSLCDPHTGVLWEGFHRRKSMSE